MGQDMMRAEIWLQDTLDCQRGIEELARRMGYSASQVRRRFRRRFGLSPGAYRDRLRLEKAARLLLHTPRDIHHIATACGYRNHSAFSRAFQRRYGHPPRRYRQAKRLQLHRQRRGLPAFAFRIAQLPTRHAALTRLYHRGEGLADLQGWQAHAPDTDALPTQIDKAPPIAIYHDQLLASSLPRIDLGVQLHHADVNLALPPSFRLMRLPAQRHACLRLESTRQLGAAVLYMASRGISGEGEPLSGDSPHLIQADGALELRIPLL